MARGHHRGRETAAAGPSQRALRVGELIRHALSDMIAASGAERILAIIGPGGIIGELSTIDGLTRSASVAALRDSELTFVSRAAFQAFADEHPEVYRHLVTLLAARLRDTDGVVAAGSFLPLKGRVARALLDLSEAFGQDVGQGRILIRQKVSQSDVAAMSCLPHWIVSAALPMQWFDVAQADEIE